jgi:hypothetical protein
MLESNFKNFKLREKKTIETDPQVVRTYKLLDTDFKMTGINKLKEMNDNMENFTMASYL